MLTPHCADVNTRACVEFSHVPAQQLVNGGTFTPVDTSRPYPSDVMYIPCVTIMEVDGSGAVNWYPEGNTYVMNEAGRTVATFAHSLHRTHTTLEDAMQAG